MLESATLNQWENSVIPKATCPSSTSKKKMIFIFFIIIIPMVSLEVELFSTWIIEINEAESVAVLQEMLDDATTSIRSASDLIEAKRNFTANPSDNNAMDTYRTLHRNRVLCSMIPQRIHNFPINRP